MSAWLECYMQYSLASMGVFMSKITSKACVCHYIRGKCSSLVSSLFLTSKPRIQMNEERCWVNFVAFLFCSVNPINSVITNAVWCQKRWLSLSLTMDKRPSQWMNPCVVILKWKRKLEHATLVKDNPYLTMPQIKLLSLILHALVDKRSFFTSTNPICIIYLCMNLM